MNPSFSFPADFFVDGGVCYHVVNLPGGGHDHN